MLTLFRYHSRTCSYDRRDETRCKCAIHMDWTSEGHRVQKSLGIRDWQAAQRKARDMEAEGIAAYLSGNGSGNALTIKKATGDFIADATNNVKPPTLKQYKIILSRLNTYCESHGYLFLKQLGVVQVREFRNSWSTYSPLTATKHIERVKRFFSWCQENGWLQVNPAKPLKSPPVEPTDVAPFSEEEIEKILKACEAYGGPNRERLIVLTLIMLATGLAIGDAAMLSKTKVSKSDGGWRVELRRVKTGAPVSCLIEKSLASRFHALSNETPFWSGQSDLEDLTKNWRKIYARVFKAAGVKDGHPHRFRHTCAKRLLLRGVPAGFVATVLGDSEAIIRKHYSKWIPERQAAVDAAIKAAWGQNPANLS